MLGGDITDGDGNRVLSVIFVGTGGMSIYGAPFEDENLNKPLDRAGLLVQICSISIIPLYLEILAGS